MKVLALSALASLMAVSLPAAASECPGWTLTILNEETKELKTWCPDDEQFGIPVPGASKDVGCVVTAVKTSKASQSARERHVMCGTPSLGFQAHAFWFPATNQGYGARFVLTDVKADVNLVVALFRGSDATAR
jgi:hypothetical protein